MGITAIQAITGFHPDLLPRDRDTGEIKWRDCAPNCSEELAHVLDKMVRNDFLQRYRNVGEVLEDINTPHKTDANVASYDRQQQMAVPPVNTPAKSSGSKRLLLFVVLPLSLGLLFLAPRIWRALQALNYYNEGNSLIEAGEFEEAIEAFDMALANRDDFAQAWTNRGFAQGKLGRHLEKFSSCVQATDVAPDFAEAWNCRGLARFDLQQYESALEEYNKAISVDTDFHRGWFNKGQVLLRMGRPQEAIQATRQVLQIRPDYFLAWTQLCRALYELEQYYDAKAHCEESIRLNPDYPPTSTLLNQVEDKLN